MRSRLALLVVSTLTGCFDFDAAYSQYCGEADCTGEQTDGGQLEVFPHDAGELGGDDGGLINALDGGTSGDAGTYKKPPSCTVHVSQAGNTTQFSGSFNWVHNPNEAPSCVWKLDGISKGNILCGNGMSWTEANMAVTHSFRVEMTGPGWETSCSTTYVVSAPSDVSCIFASSYPVPDGGYALRWSSNGSECEIQLDATAWETVDCNNQREFQNGYHHLTFRAHGDGGTKSCFTGWNH